MTIRPGRPADEPALRALQTHLREPSPALLSHGLRTGDVLVDDASGDGAPDGSDGPVSRSPVAYALPVVGDGVHVAELVVHQSRRRKGRATRLLRRLVADADGCVTLLVATDNGGARALYEGLGFRPAERHPSFYDDGTDAILMARDPE